MTEPIFIVDGARTPFLKSRNRPGPFAASDLATEAGRALLMRQHFAPSQLDEVILGCAAPSATRDRLTRGIHVGTKEDDPIALIDRALTATVIAEPVEAKLRAAVREGRLDGNLPPGAGIEVLADRALAAGILSVEEARALTTQRELMAKVILVDDFDKDLGASLLQPAIDTVRPRSVNHRAAA